MMSSLRQNGSVVGNSKNFYDMALWLRTFKDATTKKHLGRKGIRMETYKRDSNTNWYVLPSADESSRGLLSTKYKW